ncbi:hypothetical protein GW17_00033058 [Ensete ventricosum]|nr:hypothetical protein GW17_00033058 [Ensete ventricosum]
MIRRSPTRITPMGGFLGSFLLPLLLLAASLLGWNLISLIDMLLFFAILFVSPRGGMIFPLTHHLDLMSTAFIF